MRLMLSTLFLLGLFSGALAGEKPPNNKLKFAFCAWRAYVELLSLAQACRQDIKPADLVLPNKTIGRLEQYMLRNSHETHVSLGARKRAIDTEMELQARAGLCNSKQGQHAFLMGRGWALLPIGMEEIDKVLIHDQHPHFLPCP